MSNDPQDAQIIDLLWQRSELALALVRQKYGSLCQSLARRLLPPEDAEECINDSLLALWQQIPPERPASLGPYLLAILRNLSLKRWQMAHTQSRRPEVLLSLEELTDLAPIQPAADPLAEKQLLASIEAFLRSENLSSRRLFLLRYWSFLPVGEIAASLHITPNAASARLSRLRKRLKEHLEKEGFYL